MEINKSLQEMIKQLKSRESEGELVTKYENTVKVLEEKLDVFGKELKLEEKKLSKMI